MWPFTSTSSGASSSSSAGAPPGASADKCPVDDATRQAWLLTNPGATRPGVSTPTTSPASPSPAPASDAGLHLSTHREISSIPRHFAPSPSSTSNGGETHSSSADEEPSSTNWVYPSPSQFYNAMLRKSHTPSAEDMDIVVPIHNAVNEEAWRRILIWESLRSSSSPSSPSDSNSTTPKLVSFQGKPKDLTWRAWFRTLAGYNAPFDRHDWTITRNEHGTETMRYIIDFYGGKSGGLQDLGKGASRQVAFFLDVRPAPDSWEGVAMRIKRAWFKWALGDDVLGRGPQGRPTTLH
ncbi:Cytochrome c1 heme lyase [Thecaphora frezii]